MLRTMSWGTTDIPDLTGRTVIVTGANNGIGFETTAALAAAGATVVMACRNLDKAAAARAAIEARTPNAHLEVVRVDLASQAQIADAADEILERFPRVDRLVNNAGVMSEERAETEDGFELLFGTNHLGHFTLTARIFPALAAAPSSRVVTVTSLSQKVGKIRWGDPHFADGYTQSKAYAQSKLACLLFSFALQRRLSAAGVDAMSLAAHPGFAATDILHGDNPSAVRRLQRRIGERFIPSAADASRATLRAATDPEAHGGQLYGPADLAQTRGTPIPVPPSRRSLDVDAQERLWTLSERLTGVDFSL